MDQVRKSFWLLDDETREAITVEFIKTNSRKVRKPRPLAMNVKRMLTHVLGDTTPLKV